MLSSFFTTACIYFLYFCFKYITTEEGYNYYYNDLTDTYIAVCDTLGRGEYDAIVGTDMMSALNERSRYR